MFDKNRIAVILQRRKERLVRQIYYFFNVYSDTKTH